MARSEFKHWMWFEAVNRLSQAERMHQQFFTPHHRGIEPSWEPPVDVLETEDELLIFFALPGVDPSTVEAVIEDGVLTVSGRRILPEELRTALIHRLELPQGRFERRITLPANRYDAVKRQSINGCLVISLHKL